MKLKNSSEEVILNIYIPVMKKWARKKYEKSMRNSKFQEFFLTSQKSSKLTKLSIENCLISKSQTTET